MCESHGKQLQHWIVDDCRYGGYPFLQNRCYPIIKRHLVRSSRLCGRFMLLLFPYPFTGMALVSWISGGGVGIGSERWLQPTRRSSEPDEPDELRAERSASQVAKAKARGPGLVRVLRLVVRQKEDNQRDEMRQFCIQQTGIPLFLDEFQIPKTVGVSNFRLAISQPCQRFCQGRRYRSQVALLPSVPKRGSSATCGSSSDR